MKKFLTEFKEFAVRGNVIDMAVGIVIGGAFSKIVTALVNMVMSVVGLFTSAVNLSELAVTLQRLTFPCPTALFCRACWNSSFWRCACSAR